LVKAPHAKDNAFMTSVKKPLEDQYVQVIAKDLDWADFLWGEHAVTVQGTRFTPLKNYKYYPLK